MPTEDDPLKRIEALQRKVARLEQQLADSRAAVQRASVQQALLDERLLTLERNRLFRVWGEVYRTAASVYALLGAGKRLGGLSDLRQPGDYARWVNREQHAMAAEDHHAIAAGWRRQPLISVWLNGSAGARDSFRSVLDQCYTKWELCLPGALQEEFADAPADSRIRFMESDDPSLVTGEYLLVLQAGDRLSPHALHFYAQALQGDLPDMVYADEDHLDSDGNRWNPLFKPGWSPELVLSTLYIGRAALYRGTGLSLDDPKVLVRHIPRVLYHRADAEPLRSGKPQYTAPPDAHISVIICSRKVRQVRECLEAIRKTSSVPLDLLVVHHLEFGDGWEMRQCVEQFQGIWLPYRGAFDFARMNNLAAAQATSPYLLFLNDDVIVQQRGWDQAMAATLARPQVGIAGAILEYPNGTLQHAGVVTGMGDAAGHCGRFQLSSDLWPWLRNTRDVSAVTGAMLGIRRELFHEMKGFDEAFPVNYNDVDLCLRIRQAGLRVLCLNLGRVIHRESQTRVGGTRHEEREALYKRWAGVLARPDEFYSMHLAPSERIALTTGHPPLQDLLPQSLD
jgi:GT2 family glycosyltransferase